MTDEIDDWRMSETDRVRLMRGGWNVEAVEAAGRDLLRAFSVLPDATEAMERLPSEVLPSPRRGSPASSGRLDEETT